MPLVAKSIGGLLAPIGGLKCDDAFCALERKALIVQKILGQAVCKNFETRVSILG